LTPGGRDRRDILWREVLEASGFHKLKKSAKNICIFFPAKYFILEGCTTKMQ
jgi:hypothetical protein